MEKNHEAAKTYLEIALRFTDFAIGLAFPVVGWTGDWYEFASGKDKISGETLSDVNRGIALIGILTFSYGSKIAKAAGFFKKLFPVKAAARAAEKAFEVAEGVIGSAKGNFPNLRRTVEFLKKNDIPVDKRREVIEAFTPNSQVKVLTEDTKVYRYWVEGFNGPKGHWVTRNKVNDPLSELALPHSGPYKEQEWIIPKGTEILEGMAAPNFKQPGGAGQIFVPNPGALQ